MVNILNYIPVSLKQSLSDNPSPFKYTINSLLDIDSENPESTRFISELKIIMLKHNNNIL